MAQKKKTLEATPSCPNCAALQARIKELELQLSDAYDAQESAELRASEYHRKADSADRARRNAENEARDAEYAREDAVRSYERARERGDSSDMDRAMTRIKRGW